MRLCSIIAVCAMCSLMLACSSNSANKTDKTKVDAKPAASCPDTYQVYPVTRVSQSKPAQYVVALGDTVSEALQTKTAPAKDDFMGHLTPLTDTAEISLPKEKTLWVQVGQERCQMSLDGLFVYRENNDMAPRFVSALKGKCDALTTSKDYFHVGILAPKLDNSCKYVSATQKSDPKTAAAALPEPMKSKLDPTRCVGPSCVQISEVKSHAWPNGAMVYSVLSTRVHYTAEQLKSLEAIKAKKMSQSEERNALENVGCDAKKDYLMGVAWRSSAKKPFVSLKGKRVPPLTGWIEDASGPRAFVIDLDGRIVRYDIKGDEATIAQSLNWMKPHPEDYSRHWLGPDCGP